MAHTLISFLGRVPKGENGYRTTRYSFDDQLAEPTAFIGWTLRQRLAPDRLVILGTAGSMWDHLFERDINFGVVAEDERLALQEATETKTVTEALLEPLMPLLEKEFGCEVRLVLIPYCRNEAEQLELLRLMAAEVNAGDQVSLDVTHGFRHLPMLALLSAMHLQAVRNATVEGIYYGAYDHDSGEAPVYNLAGLLRIARWLNALNTYDKDGDYGAFSELLGPAGAQLAKAAFFERTSNPVKAREALTAWINRDDRYPDHDPATFLFRDQLEQRIRWFRFPSRPDWEKTLAWEYLERGDYVRAAIYGLEAVISQEIIERGQDAGDFDCRDALRNELRDTREGFKTLGRMRNAFAHGVRPFNRDAEWAISSPTNLRNTLKSLFMQLLGPQ
ncbi:MAG: TIGR02221 family CRISPR-associated protein [Candidatus Competibacteraceae bacterium]|nr:TIGR02221 family CRISPR-associated protein [Candidatus Competibacteraceae bacterium]MCB1770007.1 TIGR02221 family CRISPR-associated protein [Candidatus Competibacteraceae bacterium]MCB1820679.1 TIGR02221 family CRISPR-associated protein [Candidatus Competibacteraceae bacterium]MCP5125947.1 TIGR02221 family CRISPR-associated protein [Gammaproteobacteria bacterium]HRX69851.1 TIGR02221 family CRISPR-associated protein [Candidatus Competibacteraceae bacterium]